MADEIIPYDAATPRPQLFVSPYLQAPNLTAERRATTAEVLDDDEFDIRHAVLLTPPTVPPTPRPLTRWDHAARIGRGLRPSWMPALASLRVGIAAVLITASVAFCGYVVWETQGSQMVADSNQEDLRGLYAERLSGAALVPPPVVVPETTPVTVVAPTDTTLNVDGSVVEPATTVAPPETVPPLVPIAMGVPGDVGGHLVIPAIGVDQIVVVGTRVEDLERGPGIWTDGVMPGMPGNATLAAHRTTYGGPFRNIDDLNVGDLIYFEVPGQATAVYQVRGSTIVAPSEVGVTAQGDGVRLTLTTCEPVGSAAKRLVVQAELVEGTFIANALAPEAWTIRT